MAEIVYVRDGNGNLVQTTIEDLREDRITQLEEENKKLKKYYDRDKEELMESCYSLAKENDELKKENERLKSELQEWLNAVGNKA